MSSGLPPLWPYGGHLLIYERGDCAATTDTASMVQGCITFATPVVLPADGYPITLTGMAGALALVVGGGSVGERKVRGLLAAGIVVCLVSPAATTQLSAWAAAGRIRWEQRGYDSGDMAGARLVFAATDRRPVNALVARDAAAAGILCNVADAPAEGSFHLPALHRAAGMTVAVSSGGVAPGRAVALRDAIAHWLAGAAEGNNER